MVNLLPLELALVNLIVSLQLLLNDFSVVLLLKQLLRIEVLLIFLIPAPFVHLGLSQTGGHRNFHTRLLGPVRIKSVLLHEVCHLVRILPVSLLLFCRVASI